MNDLDSCPKCKTTWIGDEIPDGLMKTSYYKSRDDAEKAAKDYGWTTHNKKCFKLQIGVTDRFEDRIVAYECPECKYQIKV